MGEPGFSFIKGADVSTLHELESLGARFRDRGVEKDLLEILGGYGVNAVRLRLWNDPWSESGERYGAGGNDLATTTALARRVRARGMGLLLCLHYSDFWADPGKQHLPKAWRGFDDDRLERAVHDYTVQSLCALDAAGALPTLVQVGNEITNGLLWPNGKRPGFGAIARFVSAGIRAVRSVSPAIRVMIHLDDGGNNAMYREWFDRYLALGEDFDVMGLSYYPFWHGTMEGLARNLDDMARRHGKPVIVAETSMGFTTEDYAAREGLHPSQRKGMATRPALCAKVPYPMTPDGQCAFLRDLIARIRRVEGGMGKGFFYWEPAWLPMKGSGWATPAALRYTGEQGPGGNEWANQALFDYDGNALPALEAIRDG
jgi:arabinogalactan endo-1,4-beta-galactosidase